MQGEAPCTLVAGWFTEPRPFFEGPLAAEAAAPVLDDGMSEVLDILAVRSDGPRVLACLGCSPALRASSPWCMCSAGCALSVCISCHEVRCKHA
jgi:hypothetical protein